MIDRLRAVLDRPLDPSAARAILVFASAILVGCAGLFVLAAAQPDPPTSPRNPSVPAALPSPGITTQAVEGHPAEDQAAPHRQDPQDVEGSLAARRTDQALRSHRAIQHVPYRHGELAIDLVGARGDRALLRVSASSLHAARRGWRAFLRRYHDRGKAYIARFALRGRGRRR
jgi:hypothetical protein